MSKIADQIVKLDRVARQLGIDLQERGVNKRVFEQGGRRYQYEPNGSKVRVKCYDGNERLMFVEHLDPDYIIEIWRSPK